MRAACVLVGLALACGTSAVEEELGPDAGAEIGGKGDSVSDGAGGARAPVGAHGGVRVMSYNIKHGEVSSLEAIASVITAQEPDLVALQEVDLGTARSGGVDQAARLGQLTGLEQSFVPSLLSFDGGQYGLALLSRYPILGATRVALPSAAEQRIVARFDVELAAGRVVPVAVTHFGTTGASERLGQADALLAALGGDPWAIVAGDLNATPSESAITRLRTQLTDAWTRGGSGSGNTSGASFPTRRIDYILLGSAWTSPLTASVLSSTASDHRPLLASVIDPTSQTVFGDRLPSNAVEEADTRAVELGVRVRAATAGTVTAIRFYRGAATPDGYTARLWSSTGVLLAEVPVPSGPTPGWHEAPLPAPVPVAAGTNVTASYHTSTGRFARDPHTLEAAVVSGALTVPPQGGVYRYGGGFPSSTYKATNYWVDVRFTPTP